jgi:hypothetical protein
MKEVKLKLERYFLVKRIFGYNVVHKNTISIITMLGKNVVDYEIL